MLKSKLGCYTRPTFQGGNNYNPSYNSNFNSNQPPLRDFVLGQVKINENINKKAFGQ